MKKFSYILFLFYKLFYLNMTKRDRQVIFIFCTVWLISASYVCHRYEQQIDNTLLLLIYNVLDTFYHHPSFLFPLTTLLIIYLRRNYVRLMALIRFRFNRWLDKTDLRIMFVVVIIVSTIFVELVYRLLYYVAWELIHLVSEKKIAKFLDSFNREEFRIKLRRSKQVSKVIKFNDLFLDFLLKPAWNFFIKPFFKAVWKKSKVVYDDVYFVFCQNIAFIRAVLACISTGCSKEVCEELYSYYLYLWWVVVSVEPISLIIYGVVVLIISFIIIKLYNLFIKFYKIVKDFIKSFF